MCRLDRSRGTGSVPGFLFPEQFAKEFLGRGVRTRGIGADSLTNDRVANVSNIALDVDTPSLVIGLGWGEFTGTRHGRCERSVERDHRQWTRVAT